MRLIDKDLVLKTAKDKEWGLWCEIANIKFAPEVDAIPVEWIKKWLETCIPHYDYDKMTYIADVYEMIEDWEKENER